MRKRNLSHPLARDDDAVNNDRHGKQNKTNFITGTGTFCTRNSLSFYPHTRTVTPRYLPPSITDSVTSQGSPVRCGCARCSQARPAAVVRARTHTSTRAQRCLRSAHTQLAQLPYPPAPPRPVLPFQHSFGQLKIVNRPTPQTSALFSGPHGLSGSLGTS